MSLRKARVIGVSVLCGLWLCPEMAKADRIEPQSDTVSVLNDVTGGILPLTEPGDRQDSVEKNTLMVPMIAFDFTELDGTPSDELTFDPFTITFFSDLPVDLLKEIKGRGSRQNRRR